MKRLSGLTQHFALLLASFLAITPIPTRTQNTQQQLAFAGLRAIAGKGQFNSIQIDSTGNLYLLLDRKDGVRILKTDPGATQVYAQVQLGAAGDTGIAMALDPAGNVYVTGTTTSGALSATSGVAFPARADSSTNSFVARFDSALNPVFVTYAGSGSMAATAIAATSNAVFITGSIFAATLPVTASAIIQTPAPGSNGNGFVECFNSSGNALLYSTYLSGYGGDTAPAAIAVDASGNPYITGYTTSSGYPTVAAVVPSIIGTASGFLTKLSAVGDAIVFSTFIPGEGMTSIAMDRSSQNLLLSGSVALGGFPVTSVASPLVATMYQAAIRMPLDGSTVLASTLLAPGTTSVIASAANGMAWAAQPLSIPLLSLPAISSIGNTAAFRISTQGTIDQSLRMGGAGPGFTPTVPVTIASIASDASGQPIFAGNAAPTTSASLLATKTFDLPLSNSPTAALPSTVRDAMLPVGTNCGSLCTGSAAYLSKLSLTAGASLAISIDSAPKRHASQPRLTRCDKPADHHNWLHPHSQLPHTARRRSRVQHRSQRNRPRNTDCYSAQCLGTKRHFIGNHEDRCPHRPLSRRDRLRRRYWPRHHPHGHRHQSRLDAAACSLLSVCRKHQLGQPLHAIHRLPCAYPLHGHSTWCKLPHPLCSESSLQPRIRDTDLFFLDDRHQHQHHYRNRLP
jgi:hypothetical protein